MNGIRSMNLPWTVAAALAGLLAVLPGGSHALVVTCGEQTVEPLHGVLSVHCDGDLLLREGSFESMQTIDLFASGTLRLEGAWLTAPSITLAGTLVSFDGGSRLATPAGGSIALQAGALVVPAGGTLQATVGDVRWPASTVVSLPPRGAVTPVPEAPAGWLLLAGLAATLASAARRQRVASAAKTLPTALQTSTRWRSTS